PEHSSGRLERFLQLAAQGNIRIANCSTPAQDATWTFAPETAPGRVTGQRRVRLALLRGTL
ncbi:hypothetical protein EDM76_09205, partial [bacterium]